MTAISRHQIAAILLRLLAIAVALCSLPFIGEGLENLMLYGPQLWSLECFGFALIPIVIAFGLWQRRRWAWKITLWVSVPAIVLAPAVIAYLAVLIYAFGLLACIVALLLGLLFGLIVYFLIRPETKELFGIQKWPDRRRMVRSIQVAVIIVLLMVVGYAIWTVRSAIAQRNVDSQVVADIHGLMEQQLTKLGPDDSIIRRYGAFKDWERGNWSRLSAGRAAQGHDWLPCRLETSGRAIFEKESVTGKIRITNGSRALYLPQHAYLNPDSPYWATFWVHIEATHPEFDVD